MVNTVGHITNKIVKTIIVQASIFQVCETNPAANTQKKTNVVKLMNTMMQIKNVSINFHRPL